MTEAKSKDDGGVFAPLIGHDGAKAILRAALRSGDVDILLRGAPASGKSVALEVIEDAIDGAVYVDSKGLTERELRDILREDPPVVCLDEMDALPKSAFDALSLPMSQGRVTKNTNHESYDVEISTQIFAACNDSSAIPGFIMSRFRGIEFDEYTYSEYADVCEILLQQKIDWIETAAEAREIAEATYEAVGSKDPRDALDVGRLAQGTANLEQIAIALDDPQAKVPSDPLSPDELQRETSEPEPESGDNITVPGWVQDRMAEPLTQEEYSEIKSDWDDVKDELDSPEQADEADEPTPDGPEPSGGGGEVTVEIDEQSAIAQEEEDQEVKEILEDDPEADVEPTLNAQQGLHVHHYDEDHDDVHAALAAAQDVEAENLWDHSVDSDVGDFDTVYPLDLTRDAIGKPWQPKHYTVETLVNEIEKRADGHVHIVAEVDGLN